MTAFRLKAKKSTAKGIRRAAHGRAEDALRLLRDEDADPVEAVHEARKDMKKLRATLKLVRPALGDAAYRSENERFRDAGRALSDVRDAQVRAETVDALAERFADDPPPGGWWAVRAALAGDDGPDDGELGSLRERAAEQIAQGTEAIDDWPLDARGFDLLRGGLKRSYARGRRAYGAAREAPDDETLHEWRKRAKDLWYHLRLLRRSWPPVMGAVADEAHELSNRLGDEHDLAVLRAHLGAAGELLTADQASHLSGQIATRREELQAEAFAYGALLYAEKPARFAARLERYWDAATD
jgi:CHAD domain-containing protein